MFTRKSGFWLLPLLIIAGLSFKAAASIRLTQDPGFTVHSSVDIWRKPHIQRVQKTIRPRPVHKVALTFDDGPDRTNTPKILDILKEEKVVATFFVLGQKVEWFSEITERIFEEGHLLANHSRTHVELSKLTNEEIVSDELDPTSAAVEKITGFYPKIMRPPYGSLRADSVHFLRAAGWHIVRWSLDTFDWDKKRNEPEEIIQRVKENHHPNAIILMHCNGPETAAALPGVIASLRDLGYSFVDVLELLNLEPETAELN
ncbi:MAG TPA: polysaccharide deacetylase family protein [Firmicutes bacterium]|nr:polysaccharide deacetylase family protein [Bacillota bacterium]